MTNDCADNTRFRIGAGIYDITGPAAEMGMMGYARLDQMTSGIHMRLWSRAFVIESPCNGRRIVFVSTDLGMIFQAVKLEVVRRLEAKFPGVYSEANVLLSATHTHSGPGGYSHYTLYNLSTLGFSKRNFEAIVNGIVSSIVRAHESMRDGRILFSEGELDGASINRSKQAYVLNPDDERSQYGADVDKLMTVLRFQADDATEIGCIAWFAVHGTSMGNHNHLISGDNKGYASYLFEKAMGGDPETPGSFVAAFAQSNEGDVSPNIYGGMDGGGEDDFESTEISGTKQFTHARSLYDQASQPVTGGVDFRHRYVDFSSATVDPSWTDGEVEHTCSAAIGISMLAGAEDGPGVGKEGVDCSKLSWVWRGVLCDPVFAPCQDPKPIVIPSGRMRPFPWSPQVLPLQIVLIGDLALVALPFEATTMAGRRLRTKLEPRLREHGVKRGVIAGLANSYAGYLTTKEEYEGQFYEGASTHFGKWQLALCHQEYDALAASFAAGAPPSHPLEEEPKPKRLGRWVFGLMPGVIFDAAPPFKRYGAATEEPDRSYELGDTASATFWGGHPANDFMTQASFLEVQRLNGQSWETVARDRDPETKFSWQRIWPSFSKVTAEWTIPGNTPLGTYRLVVHGYWKPIFRRARPYRGESRPFEVVPVSDP